MVKEQLLHYIWRYQQFDHIELFTTQSQALRIVHPGRLNEDAGPDFLEAVIFVEQTRWHGHIEIHRKASDWIAHGHDADVAYHNVVLHVVLEEDVPIHMPGGERIPCLELANRIHPQTLKIYKKLYQKPDRIPCQQLLGGVPELTRQWWLDRMVMERMEKKQQRIGGLVARSKGDWEASFFRVLAGGFGLRLNQDAFEQVAARTPLPVLLRHRDQLFQLEALLFGQANMLGLSFVDEYPKALAREYAFLASKYNLKPIAGYPWKFSRMRPAGFPSIRLAQLAMLLHRTDHLFSKFLAIRDLEEIIYMLDVKVSGYWGTHYRFDQVSVATEKKLGKQAIFQITINALVPLLLYYGKVRGRQDIRQRAMSILEAIPPEDNSICRQWKKLNWEAQHAWDSQGLIQLRKTYCSENRCLSCGIGRFLLQSDK